MSIAPVRTAPPIHRLFKMAVWAGAEAAVRLHIARGDDPNSRDETGLTPLMIAAARNKSAVCRLLVDAGADLSALDPSGKSALEIAIVSGAEEAAAAIALAQSQRTRPVVALVPSPIAPTHEPEIPTPREAHLGWQPERSEEPSTLSTNESAVEPPAAGTSGWPTNQSEALETSLYPINPLTIRLDFEDDGEPLDVAGWEADRESIPPIDDRPAAIAHVATQEAIGRHAALDDSADWADFEADLPFHAAPLLRAQDAEGRTEIRTLLLRASREGSVPEQAIADVCRDANGARDPATEALLDVVINDMGAESDERFEFRSPFESFQAFVDPEESAEESETVDEALAFLDNLRSRHNEPIRLYMREAQRTVLLSAEEEVALGRSMDRAAESAIEALSQWPAGIEWLRRAIDNARRGERSINSIVSSPREAATPVDDVGLDNVADDESALSVRFTNPGVDDGEQDGGAFPTTADVEAFDAFALADELASLIARAPHSDTEVCAALVALSLRRSFLLELSDVAAVCSADGERYARAIRTLMTPRDRMVRANLRLVISLAKKYMYSGVPMDDLMQDGNIGLMNAVDKFDWRRGFRFSTMATWWIRQQITRSIADSSLAIRLPVHVFEIAQRFPREADAFERKTGRPPTIQQLAELAGHDWRKVETLMRASSTPLPIDSLDDEPSIDSRKDPDPFEEISAAELRRTLDELLAELGARPEKIVRLRYGIGIDEPQTLEEIGALFDVTRERIRQIESKALTKLKHPTRLTRLSSWSLDPERHQYSDGPERIDDADGEAAAPPPVAPRARPTPTCAPLAAQTEGGKRLTPVERALREATLLNIPVKQSKRGEETTTWVSLTKAVDNRHRKLIRSLMALGFEYWPGKGYWR